MLGQAVHGSGVGDAQDSRCGRSAVWFMHLFETGHFHNAVGSGHACESTPDAANGGADCNSDGDCWHTLVGGVLSGAKRRGELRCVTTAEYLVAMGERRKARRQQGGFQKHTTHAKKSQRELFIPEPEDGDEIELLTVDEGSIRSDTPPRGHRRERDDVGLRAELGRLSA